MPFVKHFVRLITPSQLDDDDVIDFFDIVQSHVPTKLASAFTDDEEVVAGIVAAFFGAQAWSKGK